MSPPWAGSSWRLTSSLLSCLLLTPFTSISSSTHRSLCPPGVVLAINQFYTLFPKAVNLPTWSNRSLVSSLSGVCFHLFVVFVVRHQKCYFSPQNWLIFPKCYSYLLHHESHLPTNWGWEIKPIFFVCNVKIFRAAPSLYNVLFFPSSEI